MQVGFDFFESNMNLIVDSYVKFYNSANRSVLNGSEQDRNLKFKLKNNAEKSKLRHHTSEDESLHLILEKELDFLVVNKSSSGTAAVELRIDFDPAYNQS